MSANGEFPGMYGMGSPSNQQQQPGSNIQVQVDMERRKKRTEKQSVSLSLPHTYNCTHVYLRGREGALASERAICVWLCMCVCMNAHVYVCIQWIIQGSAKDLLNELAAQPSLTPWEHEVRWYVYQYDLYMYVVYILCGVCLMYYILCMHSVCVYT